MGHCKKCEHTWLQAAGNAFVLLPRKGLSPKSCKMRARLSHGHRILHLPRRTPSACQGCASVHLSQNGPHNCLQNMRWITTGTPHVALAKAHRGRLPKLPPVAMSPSLRLTVGGSQHKLSAPPAAHFLSGISLLLTAAQALRHTHSLAVAPFSCAEHFLLRECRTLCWSPLSNFAAIVQARYRTTAIHAFSALMAHAQPATTTSDCDGQCKGAALKHTGTSSAQHPAVHQRHLGGHHARQP